MDVNVKKKWAVQILNNGRTYGCNEIWVKAFFQLSYTFMQMFAILKTTPHNSVQYLVNSLHLLERGHFLNAPSLKAQFS